MRLLLISTYELGHQPWHVASPAARLQADGHQVRSLDLAVEPFDDERLAWADAVAISVPMHTAMRLALETVSRIRRRRSDVPVALYGLYAGATGDGALPDGVTRAIVGEYEAELAAWASAGGGPGGVDVALGRTEFLPPDRTSLPTLDHYAHLRTEDGHRLVGYVEASHGCRHRCRHCPIPAVYDGIYRIVGPESVLADIDRQVEMGAVHVGFGDPDFLNGPAHAVRVIESAHARHPDVTFDVTVKVEHLLTHAHLLPRLADSGVIFVISAFETTDDRSLALLDKGHTVADMETALAAARAAGIEIHPSWMPFMPWTTPAEVLDIFRFVDRHDLTAVTDPVQLSIRLLIPDGSLMLGLAEVQEALGDYDPVALGYRWRHLHPDAAALQRELADLAARGADSAADPMVVFADQWRAALEATGSPIEEARIPAGAIDGRPRLTEPWFC